MIRREVLLEINKKRGITHIDMALKDYVQDKILYYTYSTAPYIVIFKGGTILFKVYGSQRFSMDIDFTAEDYGFLENVKRKLRKEGFKVYVSKRILRNEMLSTTWNVGSKGLGGTSLKLEIKISKTFEDNKEFTYSSPYPDIRPFNMRVVTVEYMFRRKLFMLLERKKVRDLFDAYFLAKTYDTKTRIDNTVWDKIAERIMSMERYWPQIRSLLINYPLPSFKDVIEVIKNHVEIG